MEHIKSLRYRVLRILSISFCLGIAIGVFSLDISCPETNICQLAGNKLIMEGRVVSFTLKKLERELIEVSINRIEGIEGDWGKVLITLPHTQYGFSYGDRIVFKGKIELPDDFSANFSYPQYLAGKGIYAVLGYPEIIAHEKSKFSLSWQGSFKLISGIREKVREDIWTMPEPYSGIVSSFVIGDQKLVPENISKTLSRVGIVHIMSVSGTHVTFLMVFLIFIGRYLRVRRIFVFLGIITYILLSDIHSSALRAGIMGITAYFAISIGRISQVKNIYWFSMVLILLINPLIVIADIGFQLSYLAVFGIIYIFPVFQKLITWGKRGFVWKTFEVFLLSFSINITVAPLILYYFNVISFISPIANIFLLPIFFLILAISFLMVIVKIKLLGFLIFLLLKIFLLIADAIERLPYGWWEGEIKIGWIVIYYSLLLVILKVVNREVRTRFFRKIKRIKNENLEKIKKKKKLIFPYWLSDFGEGILDILSLNWVYDGSKKRGSVAQYWIWGWTGMVVIVTISAVYYIYSSFKSDKVYFLNVSQGDAILIDFPHYHFQILVDGGPGRRVLAELGEVLPFWDRNIEMVVLTHAHQDHLEGIINVFERYEVEYVFLPYLPSSTSLPLFKDIDVGNAQILLPRRGDKLIVDKLEMEFLTPYFNYSGIENENNMSMVTKINYPRKILLTGDAEKELEKLLAREDIAVDILKVSHHGSKNSTCNEFLNAVSPKYAVISVGKNIFGHPSKNTIEKLEKQRVKVFRTDKGRVEFSLDRENPLQR